MSPRRIKYERLLFPALAFSAACHLLAALAPAGAVDFLIRRDTQPRRTVRFEVIELREEPLLVVKTSPSPELSHPQFIIIGTPPLPRFRDQGDWQLATVSLEGQLAEIELEPEDILAVPAEHASDQDSLARLENYLSDVAARIERARRYPEAARRMGQQGAVQVAFAIGRDGELSQPARLVEPSRFGSLNQAACNSVQRSTPFPPLPSCIDCDTLDVTVRIVFELR